MTYYIVYVVNNCNFRRRLMLTLIDIVTSCFGRRFWINESKWSNEDAWKMNNFIDK